MHAILETPRLVLRQLVPEDLDFVATMLADPDVNRYYERQFTRPDAEAWLNRQLDRYRRNGHGLWLVQSRANGEPIGQVGLSVQQVEGVEQPEIGWLLHRPYWGHGYATEAAAATRDAAFARWHYPRVISLVRPVNVPSQRVALRIGMTPGRQIEHFGMTHVVFAIYAPAGDQDPAVART